MGWVSVFVKVLPVINYIAPAMPIHSGHLSVSKSSEYGQRSPPLLGRNGQFCITEGAVTTTAAAGVVVMALAGC